MVKLLMREVMFFLGSNDTDSEAMYDRDRCCICHKFLSLIGRSGHGALVSSPEANEVDFVF
jgi:hypothetical protein